MLILKPLLNSLGYVNNNLTAAARALVTLPEPISTCDGVILSAKAAAILTAIDSLLTNLASAMPAGQQAGVYNVLIGQLPTVQSNAVVFESSIFQLTPDCSIFTAVLCDVNSINSLLSSVYSSLSVTYTQPPSPRATSSCYTPRSCPTSSGLGPTGASSTGLSSAATSSRVSSGISSIASSGISSGASPSSAGSSSISSALPACTIAPCTVSSQADSVRSELELLIEDLDYLSTTLSGLQTAADVDTNSQPLLNGLGYVNNNLTAAASALTTLPEPISTCDGAVFSGKAATIVIYIESLLTNLAAAIPTIQEAVV